MKSKLKSRKATRALNFVGKMGCGESKSDAVADACDLRLQEASTERIEREAQAKQSDAQAKMAGGEQVRRLLTLPGPSKSDLSSIVPIASGHMYVAALKWMLLHVVVALAMQHTLHGDIELCAELCAWVRVIITAAVVRQPSPCTSFRPSGGHNSRRSSNRRFQAPSRRSWPLATCLTILAFGSCAAHQFAPAWSSHGRKLHQVSVSSVSELNTTVGDGAVTTIVLAAGTYELSSDTCDTSAICINRAVTIKAEVPGSVVLNAMGGRRVFKIESGGTAELIGLNITGGNAVLGGGINVGSGGEAILTSTNIYENEADFFGGGIFVATGGEANFNNCDIFENSASSAGGLMIEGTATLIDSNVYHNKARHGYGGGLYLVGAATLVNADIYQNVAVAPEGPNLYIDKSQLNLSGTTVLAFEGVINRGGSILELPAPVPPPSGPPPSGPPPSPPPPGPPPSGPPPPAHGSDSRVVGAAVGGAVGGIVALITVIAAVVVCLKKKAQAAKSLDAAVATPVAVTVEMETGDKPKANPKEEKIED